jgi:hypothetical protein
MLTYALTYADVSGGADGSLRVWARGSVAGGGPFPSSDKPLTHPDASSASASGCPPLHSFSESEDKRFSQELQRGSGGEAGGGAGAAVTNEEAMQRLLEASGGSAGGGAGAVVTNEEEMQRLLEASGGSAISTASFFATPEPGHDPIYVCMRAYGIRQHTSAYVRDIGRFFFCDAGARSRPVRGTAEARRTNALLTYADVC